jgi:DNA polymerase III delta subunit
MKITVIYGDDVETSRKRLVEIISKIRMRGWDIVRLTKGERSIIDQMSSRTLFADENLYVLEETELLSRADLAWIKKNFDGLDANLLIWRKGNLPAGMRKNLPKGINYEAFEIPRIIFKALESIRPGNSRACLKLIHDAIENENVEFIIAMMARQLRDMYIARADSERLQMPGWRIEKLKRQAEEFEGKNLERLICRLASADVESKSGGVGMETMLDLIIARELK